MISDSPIFLGTAGWSLPREHWAAFASEGSQLQRYAGRFAAVEINSSFYRPHRPATYAKWAESVPAAFRFCVKVPKQITHERRLGDCDELLARFLSECGELGEKLGCLLLQLPPSLALDPASAARFVEALRARHEGPVVIEPRHCSWLDAETLLGSVPVSYADCDETGTDPRAGAHRTRRRRPGTLCRSGQARRLDRVSLLPPARFAAHLLLRIWR